ncbi:MAG: LPS export ABC transporter periplasmic protein LptC [Nitrospirota bacterium]
MKKTVFLVVAVLFFVVLALFSEREGALKTKVKLGDNSYMDEVTIVQKKDGATKWTLSSKKAVFVTDNEVALAQVNITFPEKELTLTSDNGTYHIEQRDLKIEKNIKAAGKNYDIVAETLFWDASRNELFSDDTVHIVGKKFHVEGDSMVATTDKATLNSNVKAIFYGK